MSSAVVKQLFSAEGGRPADCAGALEQWRHFPFSSITHHGRACCRVAREWVFATAPGHTVTLDVVCSTGIFVGFDGTLANVAVTVSYRNI